MTDYRSMIEKEYLGSWDLEREGKYIEPIVTIAKVERYHMAMRKKKKVIDPATRKETWEEERNKRIKIFLTGAGGKPIRKPFLSGPATQKVIAAMYGNHVEGWIGKKLCLYFDPEVMFGKRKLGGLRVKTFTPKGEPTSEVLDNPVDEVRAEELREADAAVFGEEPAK